MLKIEGKKAYLLEFTAESSISDEQATWLCHPSLSTGIYPSPSPIMRGAKVDVQKAKERLARAGEFYFLIHQQNTTTPVGVLRLGALDWRTHQAELAFHFIPDSLVSDDLQDLLLAFCSYAFTTLSLRRLNTAFPASEAGKQKIFTRLGFREEACLRQQVSLCGACEDYYLFGLLKSGFVPNMTSRPAVSR